MTLDPRQIVFSTANSNGQGGLDFRSGENRFGQPLNSVRITGERTAGPPDGPVSLLLGSLFGVSSFQPGTTATAARSERDIVLVLDVSGSMGQFCRFAGLTNALNVFLGELDLSPQNEYVSLSVLSVYSTDALKLVDLTSNLNQIETHLRMRGSAGLRPSVWGWSVAWTRCFVTRTRKRFGLK